MSYFPILSSPYCIGRTTLHNFSPNNWETFDRKKKFVNLTYSKDGFWTSKLIDELQYGKSKIIDFVEISSLMSHDTLPLLSLTKEPLPETSKVLPELSPNLCSYPMHRATLELVSKSSTTSYQGEINPFPIKASMLSFSPFLQFGKDFENFVLLMNLEKNASSRSVDLEVYDVSSRSLKKTQKVFNNQLNIVSLNEIDFNSQNLPVLVCRDMSFIPLYFSSFRRGNSMSMEHTHPPASFVIHGERFKIQKNLKDYWFSILDRKC